MDGTLPMIITLFVVVLLILYGSHIASKWAAMGTMRAVKSRQMQLIDRMVIGQDRMLMIVQVGERFFLIGSTGSEISLISELSSTDILPPDGEELTHTVNFKETFLEHIKPKFKR